MILYDPLIENISIDILVIFVKINGVLNISAENIPKSEALHLIQIMLAEGMKFFIKLFLFI